jgi:protein dithiol:quinone oxidoreductase
VSAAARVDSLLGASALLALAAVGVALVSQHLYDIRPCPWCVLQRVIFVALALAALLGTAWRSVIGRRAAAALALLLAFCGMAAAIWQNLVAGASASCNRTLADRIVAGLGLDRLWPDVFMATASCADARVDLLGVPYEVYSLALFALLAVLTLRVLRAAGR